MKKLIAPLLACSLAGCMIPEDITKIPPDSPSPVAKAYTEAALFVRQPDFWAKLVRYDGGIACCTSVDKLHGGSVFQMAGGQSYLGETPHWISTYGSVELKLETPSPPPPNVERTVSMGVFVPAMNFGPQSHFALSGTFQKPNHVPAKGWAFAVVARTGNYLADTPDLSKVQLTFRIRPGDVEARVQEVDADPSKSGKRAYFKIANSDPDYASIAAGTEPITLTLVVNRKTGKGIGTIVVGAHRYLLTPTGSPPSPGGSPDFPLTAFAAGSGPVLDVAGATLATDSDWDATLSVEVTDFKIWSY